MTGIAYIEACTAPLDRARRATFRWASAFPAARAILYRRDRRIAVQACAGVAFAFALAVWSPIAVMAITPAVFGVAHVASDVRYLVLRQKLARWWVGAIAAACGALFAVRVVDELAGGSVALDRAEMAIAAAWLALACVAGAAASGAWRRLAVALPVVAAVGAIAVASPATSRVVFAHLHNVVALVVWAVVFRRRLRGALAPLALVAIALAVLLSGATAPYARDSAFGLDLASVTGMLAPGVGGQLAVGLALSFVFLQSIHYAVWLGWIPQEQLPGESTMSFKSSLRSLARDLGTTGVWVVAAIAALVLVGALGNLHATRNLYLSLAVFHGYLELAMLGYLALARRRAA